MCQQFDPNFSSPEESVDGARHPEDWPIFAPLKLAKGVNPQCADKPIEIVLFNALPRLFPSYPDL